MARKGVRQLWKDKVEGRSTGGASVHSSIGYGRPKFVGTVLGIDPSLRGTGLAVVEFSKPQLPLLLRSETLKQKANVSMPSCLGAICERVLEVLDTYAIDVVALEQTIYVQNFQTAQILGAARGAAIAAAAMRGKLVYEYPPLRVKQAVVGQGRASKEQVAKTVRSLMGHGDLLEYDQSDAAAVAITHAFTFVG